VNWSQGMVKAHVVDHEHPIFKGVADFELDG
jgi:hypothetical protein